MINLDTFLSAQISMNASRIMEIAYKYATIQREAISVHVALATNSQQIIELVLVRICH